MNKQLLFLLCSIFTVMCMASPPPAQDVFQMGVKATDPNNFSINWQIKTGYFLYSDRIKIDAAANSNVQLGDINLPQALKKTDSQGRSFSVYRNQLSIPIPVLGEQPGESLINIHYQGCADDGFCYPPETRQVKLTINNNLALTAVELYNTPAQIENDAPKTANIMETVFTHHWLIVLLSFFGFGLLLSFTPCILPMVPVLSGIIVGHGKITTGKAFFLSLSYVLSMAVTYSIVGAVVALLGSNLQIIMQSPWAIGLFSLLFVLLAISMFGFFEFKLPVSWQAKLAGANRSQSSGHYIGAAIMGSLSTLILSPCVTAPLIGVLSYIAHDGNVLMGALSLFFLSLGMGTPLILIGTSAGRLLPKAGSWMNAVKAFFGVILLAVAINLLTRILPAPLIMALWAILLIFSGIYAGALIPATSNQGKFRQGVGIILLVYGLLVLIGTSMGSSNPLQPLENWAAQTHSETIGHHKTVTSINEVQQAIAKAEGKPVILDFYADWCTSCKIMEATTFKDPKVIAALKNFVVLKIDVTTNNAENKALLRKYNVVAPPTFLFFNKQGHELPQARLVGEVDGRDFLKHMHSIDNSSDNSSLG